MGELIGKDEPKEILDKWKKEKKLSAKENARILNAVSYVGTAHAVLVARLINYPPILNMPTFRVEAAKKK